MAMVSATLGSVARRLDSAPEPRPPENSTTRALCPETVAGERAGDPGFMCTAEQYSSARPPGASRGMGDDAVDAHFRVRKHQAEILRMPVELLERRGRNCPPFPPIDVHVVDTEIAGNVPGERGVGRLEHLARALG